MRRLLINLNNMLLPQVHHDLTNILVVAPLRRLLDPNRNLGILRKDLVQ